MRILYELEADAACFFRDTSVDESAADVWTFAGYLAKFL